MNKEDLMRKTAMELETLCIVRGYILAQVASGTMPKGIGDTLYRQESKLADICYDHYCVLTKVDKK